MKNSPSAEKLTMQDLPRFQQLQLAMTQHVRNPEQAYDVALIAGNEIEARRLKVYVSLFFNNVEQFFSQIFPVCRSLFTEEKWHGLVREYLKKHQAETPLFHKLGLEFLHFIQNEINSEWLSDFLQPMQVDCFLQLAHYEWVELELSVVEKESSVLDLNSAESTQESGSHETKQHYCLSRAVWPLYYQYPVQKIQAPIREQEPTETFLLAQRTDYAEHQKIEFHELSMGMYALLMSFQNADLQPSTQAELSYEYAIEPKAISFDELVNDLSEDFGMSQQELSAWLQSTLPEMLKQGWIKQL